MAKPNAFIRRSLSIYLSATDFIGRIGKSTVEPVATTKHLAVADLAEQQLMERNLRLERAVLANRLVLFTAYRLRDFHSSNWKIFPAIANIIFVTGGNIVLFSFVYFSIYKLEPAEFSIAAGDGFFDFFYFSFNNLVFNQIPNMFPAGRLSQTFHMIQMFTLFFVLVIFVTSMYSMNNEKYSAELDRVIAGLESRSIQLEEFILEEYRFANISEVIESLKAAQTSMIGLILGLNIEQRR